MLQTGGLTVLANVLGHTRQREQMLKSVGRIESFFSPGRTHPSSDLPGERTAQGIVLGEIEIADGIACISNFVGFDKRTGLEA